MPWAFEDWSDPSNQHVGWGTGRRTRSRRRELHAADWPDWLERLTPTEHELRLEILELMPDPPEPWKVRMQEEDITVQLDIPAHKAYVSIRQPPLRGVDWANQTALLHGRPFQHITAEQVVEVVESPQFERNLSNGTQAPNSERWPVCPIG